MSQFLSDIPFFYFSLHAHAFCTMNCYLNTFFPKHQKSAIPKWTDKTQFYFSTTIDLHDRCEKGCIVIKTKQLLKSEGKRFNESELKLLFMIST